MSIVSHAPSFSVEHARSIAAELFGLSGTVSPLPSERDQNFLISTEDGKKFVLKIANRLEKKSCLDFQNGILEHLSKTSQSNNYPRVIASNHGNSIESIGSGNGVSHFVRLVEYLPGLPLAQVKYHSRELLHNLGIFLGAMTHHLQDFSHPFQERDLHWDMKNALDTVTHHQQYLTDADDLKLVRYFVSLFETRAVPLLHKLRTSVIQNDGNDYNILVENKGLIKEKIAGIIDFGDSVHSYTSAELAVAMAYAILHKSDPLDAACSVVAGFQSQFPLTEQEIHVLFPMMCMRLVMSVCMSAYQRKMQPANEYLSITEKPAWQALARLRDIHPRFAEYSFREACGLPPCPVSISVTTWLRENQGKFTAVVPANFQTDKKAIIDLSIASPDISDPTKLAEEEYFTEFIGMKLSENGASLGVGRYDEARQIYASPLFQAQGKKQRSIHVGMDIFMDAGTPVFAPMNGRVHSFQNNDAFLDYGPTIILEHETGSEEIFYTLYGHLSEDSLNGLSLGRTVKKGGKIGAIGDASENGNYPPHLHFQIICDMLDEQGDFPGVVPDSQRHIWLSICPNPNLILDIPETVTPVAELNKDQVCELRRRHIGSSLSLSYRKPLKIVRGFKQYLYDESGRAYLDCVNNVAHVGHSHPRVVKAVQRQMAVLNTNTRYLHDNLVRYAQRICETLPQPLSVCFIVGSGSEANDLALRLARTHTGNSDVIVVDGAYHGNLSSLIELSPYKFDGPGGIGAPDHVHKALIPDPYRGDFRGYGPDNGRQYAGDLRRAIEETHRQGKEVAAFFCESLLSCGGQIVLPDAYLNHAYNLVRNAGGVCVADEVQVGFGRVGSHFWGFETQGVVPEIVTLGKPIGNGFPLAAVITTPAIADSFNNGMEYFNTYGGNPVACAAGLAVLDVIENEKLQEHALSTGDYFKKKLSDLKNKHDLIGDVRGLGLFIGVEFVLDRSSLDPAAEHASYIVERMKDYGVLLSTDGPLHNVIKIKPPLCFSRENADRVVYFMNQILSEEL